MYEREMALAMNCKDPLAIKTNPSEGVGVTISGNRTHATEVLASITIWRGTLLSGVVEEAFWKSSICSARP